MMSHSELQVIDRLRWAKIHLQEAISELRAAARKETKDEKSQISKFVKWDFKRGKTAS